MRQIASTAAIRCLKFSLYLLNIKKNRKIKSPKSSWNYEQADLISIVCSMVLMRVVSTSAMDIHHSNLKSNELINANSNFHSSSWKSNSHTILVKHTFNLTDSSNIHTQTIRHTLEVHNMNKIPHHHKYLCRRQAKGRYVKICNNYYST